jgi:hypothetical protein
LKTNQRNNVFCEWASSLNSSNNNNPNTGSRAEYFVMSNCHSKGFSTWCLDKVFETDPVLQQLVSAYWTVSKCGQNLMLWDCQKFMKREENNTFFTCIAQLKGFCGSSSASCAALAEASGCLITWPPRNENGPQGRGCCLSMSVTTKIIVLIRDYYQYPVTCQVFPRWKNLESNL